MSGLVAASALSARDYLAAGPASGSTFCLRKRSRPSCPATIFQTKVSIPGKCCPPTAVRLHRRQVDFWRKCVRQIHGCQLTKRCCWSPSTRRRRCSRRTPTGNGPSVGPSRRIRKRRADQTEISREILLPGDQNSKSFFAETDTFIL